jgi:hypothetical protein
MLITNTVPLKSTVFFFKQSSVSKFPERQGCTTLKPFVSKHLYRKISQDQVWGYVNNFQKSDKFQVYHRGQKTLVQYVTVDTSKTEWVWTRRSLV